MTPTTAFRSSVPSVRRAKSSRAAVGDPYAIIVLALTLVAFGLRVALMRDSLLGDEVFMFNIVHGRSLGTAMSIVRNTEKTPPLFFLLTWASAKTGDPTYWIRLPSVLLGTALVPLGYALGVRTVGRAAGLVAAAILALDPYSIFYGTEARAYAAVAFFAALSTLCLLEALRTERKGWWVAYGSAVLAVLYTHYVGFFVVAVQAVWGLWTYRERLKAQVIIYALVALAYVPWVPSYLLQQQHSADEAHRIATLAPPTWSLFGQINAQALLGHPFVPLSQLPGTPAVALALGVLGVAALAAMVRAYRERGRNVRLSSPVTLIALLAVATPIGIGLISLQPGMSFMLARNLIPSLIAEALLVGWLVTSVGRRASSVAVALILLVLAVGAVRGLGASSRRTPYRAVAHWVEARARPGDPIIQAFFVPIRGPLFDVVLINLRHPHPILHTPAGQRRAWALGRTGADVFSVVDLPGIWKTVKHMPRFAGPGNAFVLVAEHRYVGIDDALVGEYRLRPTRLQ